LIRPRLAALSIALAILALAMRPAMAQDLISDISNHLISITSDFKGTELLVFGSIEGGGDVVVVVSGPRDSVVVRKKDRVFGIWINADSAEFRNVPAFYAVASTNPLEELATPEQLRLYEIGLAGLRVEAEADVDEVEKAEFLAALIELKQSNNLFPVAPQHIDVVGDRLFRVKIPFPADVPVGSYLVQSFLIRDGQVVGAQTSPLVVNKGGFGADLYEFAHEDGTLYGILAVLGAVMAGLLGNLMFRRP
jgi:uncharacterized protein (TIGR02186 family)